MRNFNLSLLAFAVSASLAGNALAQNDDCTGAVSVIQGPNGPFTNVGSSTSTPAWPCAAGGSDVWYVYVAPAAGSLTLDVCGASYDSALEIFDGSAGCGALTSIACNDDSCGLASSITTTVNAGKLVVDSQQASAGAASVANGATLAVTVTSWAQWQPASLTLGASTLEFSSVANPGTTPAPLNPASVIASTTSLK